MFILEILLNKVVPINGENVKMEVENLSEVELLELLKKHSPPKLKPYIEIVYKKALSEIKQNQIKHY